jgi:selenocysteine-specific elongation factor
MAVGALAEALGIQRDVANGLVSHWQDSGVVVRHGSVLSLPERGSRLTPEQRRAADRALEELRRGGASPPGLKEVGLPLPVAKALERAGELVLVTPEIAYPRDVWDELQGRIAGLIAANGPATVSRIREAIGTSRRYAVPLLEKLDAGGITRRRGDLRELGPRGRELQGIDRQPSPA